MMTKQGVKMKLHRGKVNEYRERHDRIWPELTELLKQYGISDYSIFLDEETHILFGVMTVTDKQMPGKLEDHPVMKKWWDYMKDIMETNPDNSPVAVPLQQVFYMQ